MNSRVFTPLTESCLRKTFRRSTTFFTNEIMLCGTSLLTALAVYMTRSSGLQSWIKQAQDVGFSLETYT